MNCKWCGKETESEDAQFCSIWHKMNYRASIPNVHQSLQLEEWEYSHLPLNKGGIAPPKKGEDNECVYQDGLYCECDNCIDNDLRKG